MHIGIIRELIGDSLPVQALEIGFWLAIFGLFFEPENPVSDMILGLAQARSKRVK
jgi:hypothetical protein